MKIKLGGQGQNTSEIHRNEIGQKWEKLVGTKELRIRENVTYRR